MIGLQSPFDIDILDMNIKGANKKFKKLDNVELEKTTYFNITQQNFEHFSSNIFFSCSVFVIMSTKKNTFSFIKYKSPIEGKCLKKEELGLCHVFYHYELGFFCV